MVGCIPHPSLERWHTLSWRCYSCWGKRICSNMLSLALPASKPRAKSHKTDNEPIIKETVSDNVAAQRNFLKESPVFVPSIGWDPELLGLLTQPSQGCSHSLSGCSGHMTISLLHPALVSEPFSAPAMMCMLRKHFRQGEAVWISWISLTASESCHSKASLGECIIVLMRIHFQQP